MSDMISGDEACYYPVTDCVLAYEVRRLTAALAERDAMLAEAREALEPFAKEAAELPPGLLGEDTYWHHLGCADTGDLVRSDFNVRDIRSARAALARIDTLKGARDV